MAQTWDIDKVKSLSAVFVIFGATGDLSRKKIFPSFFELSKANLLPNKFKIIGAARSGLSKEAFQNLIKEHLQINDQNEWKIFSEAIDYISCDVEKNVNLDKVWKKLEDFEKEASTCPQRIYYMAISPHIYEKAFENIGGNKLHLGCEAHHNKSRIVVEKPFGYDFESAQRLHQTLAKYFVEEQIFRIDHFLAKQTVQNIFAFRFGNEIFEPIWNKNYVDNIQITMAEYPGIGKRGPFYDKVGALRDVVQNHLLQLLTLVTMEEPLMFDQKNIRGRKLEILNNLKKFSPQEVAVNTVRGQYQGYLEEENIPEDSKTETFASVKLYIDNERWQSVPIYIRTGKRLMGNVTSIILSFKESGHKIFENFWEKPIPNYITIQIQPTEGFGIRIVAKKPGFATELEPIDLEYCYKAEKGSPNAYERLLIDVILGDRTLFLGQIGPSWKFIDPIRKTWDTGKPKLVTYKPGTWGPKEAEDFIKRDEREWLAPLLTICKI